MPPDTPSARQMSAHDRVRETKLALGVVAATVAGLLVVALVGGGSGQGSATASGGADGATVEVANDDVGPDESTAPADQDLDQDQDQDLVADDVTGGDLVGLQGDVDDDLIDLVGPEPGASTDGGEVGDDCVFEGTSARLGNSGDDVRCLQAALADAGYYSGAVSGEFDQATFTAVRTLQEERDLFVDGVAGRETALSLDIWPDEESFVVRTPPPPPGAVDSLGYPLSSVATTGADAPPLPEGSGTGRRLVYERQGQRVWAVDEDENVIRSWLVTGSQYNNELPGTHYVYSRSIESTAWNGAARLPKMVRWLQTERGHIGFHGIPTRMDTGEPYQTDAELGTRLSGGCQRQADLDADFVWDFAPEGTKVVVL